MSTVWLILPGEKQTEGSWNDFSYKIVESTLERLCKWQPQTVWTFTSFTPHRSQEWLRIWICILIVSRCEWSQGTPKLHSLRKTSSWRQATAQPVLHQQANTFSATSSYSFTPSMTSCAYKVLFRLFSCNFVSKAQGLLLSLKRNANTDWSHGWLQPKAHWEFGICSWPGCKSQFRAQTVAASAKTESFQQASFNALWSWHGQ